MEDDSSVFDVRGPMDVIEVMEDPDRPSMLSPEWSDYVMSQFTDKELIEINKKKYPNCYGLRRLVRELVGDIVISRPTNVVYTDKPVPKVSIQFEISVVKYDTNELVVCGDVASVSELNTDDTFLGYAEETAATRAESRCLRKLLMLNCVSADELTREKNVGEEVKKVMQSKPTDGKFNGDEKASDSQKGLIRKLCYDLKLDVLSVINVNGGTFTNIEDISKDDAKIIIPILNGYKTNKDTIPEKLFYRGDR